MMSIANRFLASLCLLSLLPKDVNAQEVRDTISTKVTLVGPTVPIKKAVIAKINVIAVADANVAAAVAKASYLSFSL
jgi:hypothetical protein